MISTLSARIALIASSNGDFVFSLITSLLQNSGAVAIVISTSFISPSFSVKVLAILSIRLCGGLSLTKRTAIFLEINFAVEGWCASIFKSCTPSSYPPFAAKVFPNTVFSLLSCRLMANKKSPSCTNPCSLSLSSPNFSITFLIALPYPLSPMG